ncbi:hypothetical protein N9B46_05195 [Mariniblastus sp.]|nr:hypothetical protein [Mariniblastus sp.]
MLQPKDELSKPFTPSHGIDLEGIGLATIVFVERARRGITTPIELKAELLQLVSDQSSPAKEGRCGE